MPNASSTNLDDQGTLASVIEDTDVVSFGNPKGILVTGNDGQSSFFRYSKKVLLLLKNNTINKTNIGHCVVWGTTYMDADNKEQHRLNLGLPKGYSASGSVSGAQIKNAIVATELKSPVADFAALDIAAFIA